jgi:hypothetical protein
LFRWLVGLGIDDPVWDHSTFSKNRDRLLAGNVATEFLGTLLDQPRCIGSCRVSVFSVDSRLIQRGPQGRASGEDDAGGAPDDAGRTGGRDVHGEGRRNLGPASTTDPSARLFAKGPAGRPGSASWAAP